jgi:hypothetical protein
MLLASKYQLYADLAERQTRQVTQSMGDWTGFLSTAGRLYKYPFEEQLMIHAQRPDATACATYDYWNKPMNRYVKGGSKGIALLDNSGGKGTLKYVFDVADTEDGRYNTRRPYLWELKAEHEKHVVEALNNAYDLSGLNLSHAPEHDGVTDIGEVLFGLAQSISVRYYGDNSHDIV